MHNQGSHHNAWAANWLGAPWLTQAATRRVLMNEMIGPKGVRRGQQWWELGKEPEQGYETCSARTAGADDLGSMTAMSVWMILGVFPMIPGEPGFTVGSPLISRAVLHRGPNGRLTIVAKGAHPQAPYVQSLTIDGKPHGSSWIPFRALKDGSVLEFTMGREPNRTWGRDPEPPSFGAVPWYRR